MIFKHSIPDNIEITLERSKVIAIAILDKLNINSGENIYIIDPYFEPKSHLFDYISKNTYDDGVWPFIIKFMVENINKGQIQILTSYTLEHLIEVLGYKNPKKPLKIEISDFAECPIFISRLPTASDDMNRSPKDLHDRVIYKKGMQQNIGIHIGPSLTHIQNKDCTITLFSNEDIDDAIMRFEAIWMLANIITEKN